MMWMLGMLGGYPWLPRRNDAYVVGPPAARVLCALGAFALRVLRLAGLLEPARGSLVVNGGTGVCSRCEIGRSAASGSTRGGPTRSLRAGNPVRACGVRLRRRRRATFGQVARCSRWRGVGRTVGYRSPQELRRPCLAVVCARSVPAGA